MALLGVKQQHAQPSLMYLTNDPDDSEAVFKNNLLVILTQYKNDRWSGWVGPTCETSKLAIDVIASRKNLDVAKAERLFEMLTVGFKGESWSEWAVRMLRRYYG